MGVVAIPEGRGDVGDRMGAFGEKFSRSALPNHIDDGTIRCAFGGEVALQRANGNADFRGNAFDICPLTEELEDGKSPDLINEGFRRFVGRHAAKVEDGELLFYRHDLTISTSQPGLIDDQCVGGTCKMNWRLKEVLSTLCPRPTVRFQLDPKWRPINAEEVSHGLHHRH